jgi:hypothetical protein
MQRIIAMQHCLAKNALANRGSLRGLWCRIAKPSLLSDNIFVLAFHSAFFGIFSKLYKERE